MLWVRKQLFCLFSFHESKLKQLKCFHQHLYRFCLWNVADILVISLKTVCKLFSILLQSFQTIILSEIASSLPLPLSSTAPCNFRQIAVFLYALCFYLFKMRTRPLMYFSFKPVTLMNKYINTGVLRECEVLLLINWLFIK